MKKYRWLIITLLVLGAFTAGVHASDGIEKITASLRPDYQMELNGEPVVLNDPPILYEGRTYLPVRSLAVILGADIAWHNHKKLISIKTRTNPAPPPVQEDENKGPITGVIVRPDQPKDPEPEEKEEQPKPKDPLVPVGPKPPEETDEPEDVLENVETFRFHTLMQYSMKYKNKYYPVLVNVARDQTVYVRVSDLKSMVTLDLTKVKAMVEEETGQLFVRFNDVRSQIDEQDLVVYLLEEPVVNSVPSSHLSLLLEHGEDAHYIRPISGAGQYEMVFSTDYGLIYAWHVEIDQVAGYQYLNYIKRVDFYQSTN